MPVPADGETPPAAPGPGEEGPPATMLGLAGPLADGEGGEEPALGLELPDL